MRIELKEHELNLLTRRSAALADAAVEVRLTDLAAGAARKHEGRETAAMNDVISMVLAAADVPDGTKYEGYTFGKDAGGMFLELKEPLPEADPGGAKD